MKTESKKKTSAWPYVNYSVAIVLIFAFFLSLMVGGRDFSSESIKNAKMAFEVSRVFQDVKAQDSAPFELYNQLTKSVYQLISDLGARDFILAGPLAILYIFFDVNSVTTAALPLLSFLITVFLAYRLGAMFKNSNVGLLTAFVFAIFPQNIYYSSIYSPITFVIMFNMLAMYSALRLENANNTQSRIWALLSCVAAILAGFALAEWGLWIAAFISLYLLRHKKTFLLLAALISAYLWVQFAGKYLVVYSKEILIQPSPVKEFLSVNGFSLLILFALAGVIQLQNKNHKIFLVNIGWIVLCFIWITPYYYAGFSGIFLPLSFPLAFFAAEFLNSESLAEKVKVNHLIVMTVLLLASVAYLAFGQDIDLVPGLTSLSGNRSWSVENPLLVGSSLIGGLLPFLLLIGLFGSKWSSKQYFAKFLIFIFSLLVVAAIGPLYSIGISQRERVFPARELLETVSSESLRLPLYVEDPLVADRLMYHQGFSADTLDIVPMTNKQNLPDDAYILLSSRSEIMVEDSWWFMQQFFEGKQSSFWLLRKLSKESAQNQYEFILDQEMTTSSPNPKIKLTGALINLERYCEAYDIWMDLIAVPTENTEFIPITHTECFAENVQMLENMAVELGDPYSEWFSLPGRYILIETKPSELQEEHSTFLNYHPHDSVFYDDSSIFRSLSLKPNTVYFFMVKLSSAGLASPLYWRINGQEGSLHLGKEIPESTEYAIILRTPEDMSDFEAYISPALFRGKNTVLNIQEIYFGEINYE